MRKQPVRHVRILPVSGAPLRPAAVVTPVRMVQRYSFAQLRRRLSSTQLGFPSTLLPPQCDEDGPQTEAEDTSSEGHEPALVRSDQTVRLDPAQHLPVSRDNDSDALGRQIAAEWIRTQRAQMAITHIALRVADFCNATPVRGAGTWEAWLDINQDIVAQTTLFLRLSPDHLLLRFSSSSPDACEVLSSGKERLDTALKAALSSPLQISIEVI
ncbi:TPA: type III secretion system protein SctP [Xanthomonas vasicola pv. zeae]|uniref:Type III secretion protein n=3 Tax=Xanthomonas vasicola TaxID=56459 RepID=A0A836P5G9_XANVA|nr:type III secretion system protein SctP [Xanthomonas vasicola]KFA38739.1 type III secretion protein [Xanthomonas vasicola pv. musacearum NCPPB 4384]AVQ05609.1 type III secretion protein [Xanthomonas vasicola pv. vasculorum]AZM69807.1 type III secretion protein [Xanthomonas vasicola pv. vasculorum]AZR29505.1 type III secretion protein [Xanthomonas vasicola pv. musacearum NCPPB 4379]KEZ96119.1 type III secretion protein [Xanthomonas vasicola pv. vasculorum NCPPB 895]